MDMPRLIYGTAWKKEATTRLTEAAIAAGFNAIDTANQPKHYQEPLVGEALASLYKKGRKRQEFFLQTKFTPLGGQDHRLPYDPEAELAKQVQQSFASSLKNLHTDYLDSYLLHGPYSGPGLTPSDWEVWGEIENMHQSGKAKLIGISNVNLGQIQQLTEQANVRPMVVQNRCFASRGWDKAVREFCVENGIIYQGFSLLTANPEVVQSRVVHKIAERYGKTPAQVVLRFSNQIGMVVLTGTTDERHMKQDLEIEKFELSPEEVSEIGVTSS